MKLLEDDSDTGRHIQIMNQVVGLDNVDVAVFVREGQDLAKGEEDCDSTDIVMFHMTGKHCEATVACSRQTERRTSRAWNWKSAENTGVEPL